MIYYVSKSNTHCEWMNAHWYRRIQPVLVYIIESYVFVYIQRTGMASIGRCAWATVTSVFSLAWFVPVTVTYALGANSTNRIRMWFQHGWVITYIIKHGMKLLIPKLHNGADVEVWEWISNPHAILTCDYLSMSVNTQRSVFTVFWAQWNVVTVLFPIAPKNARWWRLLYWFKSNWDKLWGRCGKWLMLVRVVTLYLCPVKPYVIAPSIIQNIMYIMIPPKATKQLRMDRTITAMIWNKLWSDS